MKIRRMNMRDILQCGRKGSCYRSATLIYMAESKNKFWLLGKAEGPDFCTDRLDMGLQPSYVGKCFAERNNDSGGTGDGGSIVLRLIA